MLRFVTVALLLVGGGNAELLRGVKREDDPNQKLRKLMMDNKSKQVKGDGDEGGNIRDDTDTVPPSPPKPTTPAATTKVPAAGGTRVPTSSTCICETLCWQCHRQDPVDMPLCDTACAIARNKDTCVANCDAFMAGEDIRDDDGTGPPLPTDPTPTTKVPTTVPAPTTKVPTTDPAPTTKAPTTGGTVVPPSVPAGSTTCLCKTLCWECEKQGLVQDIPSCKAACDIAGDQNTCVANCEAFIAGGGDIRDDGGTLPPLPTNPPGNRNYCYMCVDLCQSCSKGASCKTVCDISKLPSQQECSLRCYDTLNLDEWGYPAP